MSNFWAVRLGGGAPAPAQAAPTAPQAPVQPAGTPWWSSPAYGVPTAPVAPQMTAQAHEVNAYGGTSEGAALKAQSAKSTGVCPDCGSGNIRGGLGANEMTRCYECGYNPRFTQSGQGGGGLPSSTSGASAPSRQVASGGAGGVSNFQPQNPAAGSIK